MSEQIESFFWSCVQPIKGLLDDPSITEVSVNGSDGVVWLAGQGGRSKADVILPAANVKAAIKALARINSRDAHKNSEDAVISQKFGEFRVTGILNPVSYKGDAITIRKHTLSNITLDEMVGSGTMLAWQAEKIKEIMQVAGNTLVAGGTGAGKTTVINAMAEFIPEHERIVVIEDGVELLINTPNNIRLLEHKIANITTEKLLHASLRLTPDRIVVGEIRKKEEAATFLDILNAGHDGCMSTIHANSAALALMRFDSLVQDMTGSSIESIRGRTASTLQYVIHFKKDKRTHKRSLTSIIKITGIKHGEYELETITEDSIIE